MLRQISLLFPIRDEKSRNFFSTLKKVLGELPNATKNNDEVTIQATNPPHAFPEMVIKKSDDNKVKIQFDNNSTINDEVGEVLNSAVALEEIGPELIGRISIFDFYDKVKGHIVRIDHAGINIPSSLTKGKWDLLIKTIAKITAMYNYPTGEDWPFILPSTKEEYESDIANFQIGREPKFELVYDQYGRIPTIQFDIGTDLTQKEVEGLFPDPIGQSFKGLEAFFRAVYVFSPYANLSIRFDIRFNGKNMEDEWSTGKWLVEEGKRIGLKN